MRQIAVLTSLIALAGCQTMDASYGLAFGANTGHLTHRFTNVEVGKSLSLSGHTNAIYFDEVFRNNTSLAVHLTRSELCYATGECYPDGEYDIRVPANGSATLESHVETSAPATEAYTETYFGTDASGAPVALTVIFRAADYRRRAAPPASAPPPASGSESARAQPLAPA